MKIFNTIANGGSYDYSIQSQKLLLENQLAALLSEIQGLYEKIPLPYEGHCNILRKNDGSYLIYSDTNPRKIYYIHRINQSDYPTEKKRDHYSLINDLDYYFKIKDKIEIIQKKIEICSKNYLNRIELVL